MEPSFSALSIGLLNPLLHLLVKSGKMESIMKVFEYFHMSIWYYDSCVCQEHGVETSEQFNYSFVWALVEHLI